jgi:triphosphoribosyl-dephospho-CoA synthase
LRHAQGLAIGDAIRCVQGEWLAMRIDSLIARKHGREVAEEVRRRAANMVQAGPYASPPYEEAWSDLDTFLREPSKRKNPGTLADLIAAALYVESAGWIETTQ